MQVRPLTDEELAAYNKAAIHATLMVPAFRDGIALLHPFFDPTATTAYTDKTSRMGLSPWFFNLPTLDQQATVILHEVMHVVNNHFQRQADLEMDPQLGNIAGDYEINSGLRTVKLADISIGIHPDDVGWKPFQSMESYYKILRGDADNCPEHGEGAGDEEQSDGQPQSSSGDNQPGEDSDSDETSPTPSSSDSDTSDEAEEGWQSSDSAGGGSDDSQEDDSEASSTSSSSGTDSTDDIDEGESDNNSTSAGGEQNEGNDSEASGGSSSPDNESSDSDGTFGGNSPTDEPSTQSVETSSTSQNQSKHECSCAKGHVQPVCDEATQERADAADEAGIEQASDIEESIAKQSVKVMAEEALRKSLERGHSGSADTLLKVAVDNLEPPKIKWQNILRLFVGRSSDQLVAGQSDYSYKRPNKKFVNSDIIMPGMVQYEPTAVAAVDTSGSMGRKDLLAVLTEVEGIIKKFPALRQGFRIFCVDTKLKDVQMVRKVADLDLTGGGGTAMAPAWRFVRELPVSKRPDIFMLFTDGGIDWSDVLRELQACRRLFKSIILITSHTGFERVPPEAEDLAMVLDISRDV